MGNVHSRRNKQRRPSVIRADSEIIEENEHSNTTATSINSILVTHNNNSIKDEAASCFPNSIEQDTITSFNEMTLSSENQLTTHSFGKNLDIDECINRLLEVGTSGKITKSICFKHSEIVAICRAAQEVFLSQPVSHSVVLKKNRQANFYFL